MVSRYPILRAIGRLSLIVATLFLAYPSTAQELLTPLRVKADRSSAQSGKNSHALRLPFVDDFSDYLGRPDSNRWLPSASRVNRDYDALPPTIGMVTLDAIADDGRFHPRASTEPFDGDTLQSCPIRLDSIWEGGRRATHTSDSIALSFYYLPAGGSGAAWQHIGSRPSATDSLILEFWNATQGVWYRVWATGGVSVDSLLATTGHRWQRVNVMVDDDGYLSSNFSFRFRNICSLDNNAESGMVGNGDQWMIDYVQLEAGRSSRDSIIHDVAFVSAPPSMLRDYQCMPARHYTSDAMADSLSITITNRYNTAIATHYQYSVIDNNGTTIASYDGGYANVPPFLPGENYQRERAHTRPPVSFTFPLNGDQDRRFSIRHEVREGVGGDAYSSNDVMIFEQRFAHYFAYDDGIPEKGYGVITTGHAGMAMRYDMTVADTLTAVDMLFNRTWNDANTLITFRLAVWADDNGAPGELLYRDESLRHADADQIGHFQRMVLESPLLVDAGTLYVGLLQQSQGYINLGFDCSNDHHDRCYYTTANQWFTTVYSGSLMIRPCVGHNATLAVDECASASQLRLYPTPAHDVVHLEWSGWQGTAVSVAIYDAMGRRLAVPVDIHDTGCTAHVASLPHGCYMVVLTDNGGSRRLTKRFVK